jgi:broad specificity phosphatase PhoE
MRHGKPKIDNDLRVSAEEFGIWVQKYNASGIDTAFPPSQLAIEQANLGAFTVCSNLPRSLESANALGLGGVGICDPAFREMEMPHAAWRFPKLPLVAWSVFFRLAWVLGYSANAESFKAARARARSCAKQLTDLAIAHDTVLFIGHGSLNWFIAKYLKGMGWQCAEEPPGKYWEFSVYRLRAT